MKTIEEIILNLIHDQKRVFLTGLGQFSVEQHSASIHPVTHEMTPPHSSLAFSCINIGDDDQLVNAVRDSQNISTDEASHKVDQYLAILKNTLTNTKSFIIEKVCTVTEIGQESYSVVPFEGVVIDQNDIGLMGISAAVYTSAKPEITPQTVVPVINVVEKPVQVTQPIVPIPVNIPTPINEPKNEVIKQEPIIMEEKNTQNEPIQPEVTENQNKAKKSKKGIWIFIILLLLAMAGVLGFLFKDEITALIEGGKSEVKTDTTTVADQKIDSVATSQTEVTAMDTAVNEPAVVENQPVVEAIAVEKPAKKVSTGEKADLSVIVYAPKNAGKYYVIAMSFKDLGNASKGVKQLKRKGYNPVVIDKNEQGLYRIAYKPGFETERLARDLADELYEKQNLDPWIVKY